MMMIPTIHEMDVWIYFSCAKGLRSLFLEALQTLRHKEQMVQK